MKEYKNVLNNPYESLLDMNKRLESIEGNHTYAAKKMRELYNIIIDHIKENQCSSCPFMSSCNGCSYPGTCAFHS